MGYRYSLLKRAASTPNSGHWVSSAWRGFTEAMASDSDEHYRGDKPGITHQEFLHDHDITGNDDTSSQEVAHLIKLTPEERILEKKLRRKIDLLIMPLVILVYLMNYIDRNNYAAAKLQGLRQDLHLSGSQYEVGLSILFVGYVRFIPSSHENGIKKGILIAIEEN